MGNNVNRRLVAVDEDLDLERAAEMMRDARLRRLPVTEDGGRVVGILSLDDLALDVKHYVYIFLTVAGQYRQREHRVRG